MVIQHDPDLFHDACLCSACLRRRDKIKYCTEMLRALHFVVETWDAQSGRVFESMGENNERAKLIDNAVNVAREAAELITK